MLKRAFVSLLTTGCFLLPSVTFADQVLKSPWDQKVSPEASSSAGESFTCPKLRKIPDSLSTTSYYKEGSNDTDKNKISEYSDNTKIFRRAVSQSVDAADKYLTSNDSRYAHCGSLLILNMAEHNMLGGKVSGPQSFYFRAWMLNAVSIAWLKMRSDSGRTDEQEQLIVRWLSHLASETSEYFEARDKRTGGSNNLRYWAGSAVMSASIATNSQDSFSWGISTLKIGIDSIRKDGALPQELNRKNKALHYHVFASGPLLLMSQFARTNDIFLDNRNNHGLERLIKLTLNGIGNPDIFEKLSGVPQMPIDSDSINVAWLRFAERCYLIAPKIRGGNIRPVSSLYLGGMPPPLFNCAK